MTRFVIVALAFAFMNASYAKKKPTPPPATPAPAPAVVEFTYPSAPAPVAAPAEDDAPSAEQIERAKKLDEAKRELAEKYAGEVKSFEGKIAELLSPTQYSFDWAKPFESSCESLLAPGTCKGDIPIALIAYDRYAFAGEEILTPGRGKLTMQHGPGMDCAMVRDTLQAPHEGFPKGLCVEGVAVEHGGSLSTLLTEHPELEHRYRYLSNVTHGAPGKFETGNSICANKARENCFRDKDKLSQEDYTRCMNLEAAKEENKDFCPCYETQSKLNISNNMLESLYSESTVGNPGQADKLLNAQSEYNTNFLKLKECMGEEPKLQSYNSTIDPKTLTALVRPGGLLISHSCATAEEPLNAVIMQKKMCDGAPEGMIFNLALVNTHAGLMVSGDDIITMRRQVVSKLCGSAQCTNGFARNMLMTVGTEQKENYIVQPATGSFVCFICQGGVANSQACPPYMAGLNNLPRDKYDQYTAELSGRKLATPTGNAGKDDKHAGQKP